MYLETTDVGLLDKLKKMNFEIYFPRFVEGNFYFTNKQYPHHLI